MLHQFFFFFQVFTDILSRRNSALQYMLVAIGYLHALILSYKTDFVAMMYGDHGGLLKLNAKVLYMLVCTLFAV